MAIAMLAEDDLILADQANACFAKVDDALRCLFAGCSPILWLGLSGTGSYQAAGMCGVVFVFGTIGSRKILAGVSSHDQDAIDAAVAAASTYGATPQDDSRKQLGLNLATGYLRNSLVTQTRVCTPPSGPDAPYWVRVPLVSSGGTQYWQHEHPHELAVADVIFEGHADREFTWKEEWTKFRCLRFHNLDSDAEDLVVTMESTGEKISIPRWGVKSVRLNAAGTSWVEEGFLLFRMRDEDVARFGGTLPWNPRSEVIDGATYESVWTSDAANNVASFASLWRWIDWFSAHGTPAEYLETCGDGLTGAFDPRTGIHFDLSNITRNSYLLPEWPDPTDPDTALHELAWHGGAFYLYRKPTTGAATIVSVSASLDQLLAGHVGSNLTLTIDSGSVARLHLTSETGVDYYELLPVSTNLGASGHPFTIEADGVGYTVPPCTIGGPAIRRLKEATVSESVAGIGTTGDQDYTFLELDDAWDGLAVWHPWTSNIGDVQGWTFSDATKNNDHCTFMTNSVKWDGRRLAINIEIHLEPDAGACPDAGAVAYFAGNTVGDLASFRASGSTLEWFQAAVVQDWPTRGGLWLVREYRRRRMPQGAPPLYHPHTDNAFGNASGEDWQGRDTTRFPTGSNVARQGPPGSVESADLSDAYQIAPDSTDTIVDGVRTLDAAAVTWWESNRTDALAGDLIGSEIRPAIAVPLMARHFNVLAQRLNAISEVIPFAFLDAQWYGRPFRPSQPGIFDGHIYPEGFLCLSTGTAATRAGDLGITITDFGTEYAALEAYTDADLDSSLPEDDPFTHPEAFRTAGAGGINLWSTDLPLWFHPEASISPKERTIVSAGDAGDIAAAGWSQGELAGTFGLGSDHYWYWKPTTYDFPDFEYLTVADVASVASDLGIPFRLLRLSTTFDVALVSPDGDGEFGVRKSIAGSPDGFTSLAVKRQDLRLVAGVSHQFEAFAGTGELWGAYGLVRIADWALHPSAASFYATADAAGRQSVANPMHNLDRGAGSTPPAWGSAAWQNDDPFAGETESVRIQIWDTCPTAPTGWSKAAHRLGAYPVPIVQWGATDIEAQSAPAVAAQWHDVGDLGEFVGAGDLWAAAGGSGAWSGSGAFGVHLLGAGYRPA